MTACHVSTYYYVGFCYMMLRRYTDATRTFVSILNLILRMRQYHTRSYQYDQINKTADRMYALFAICNALSPSRLDDNILNIVKERFGEQVTKMSRGEEGIPAFEELFTYACPKFVSANPPPYDDAEALTAYLEDSHIDPAQRHLKDFIADVRAQLPVPTLRSFLKLYTSLGTSKLAGFLDTDEEAMVQQLMVLKQASRSIGRVGNEKGLLEGSTVSNNDLDFVIDEVMPTLRFRSFQPLTTAPTLFPIEHGSHHRVDRGPSLRRVVHPKYGARSTCVRWSQEFSAPSSDQANQSSGTTARSNPTTATGHSRQDRRLGWGQSRRLDRILDSSVLHTPITSLYSVAQLRIYTLSNMQPVKPGGRLFTWTPVWGAGHRFSILNRTNRFPLRVKNE